jgi:hypothetical protein
MKTGPIDRKSKDVTEFPKGLILNIESKFLYRSKD